MKLMRLFRLPLIWILCLAFSNGLQIVAQETNLLTNPGFEAPYSTLQGDQPRSVANGWTPWNVARVAGMAEWQNSQPKYIAASAANSLSIFPRIRSGNDAQIYYSFFETHDGGLYQQVRNITPGTELRLSVYAHVWSSTFEDFNDSDQPGDVAFRVGIDPSGGTNPLGSSVVYSTPAVFYDTFRQYSVIATATSSTVTVFLRSSVGDPVQNTYIYVDDAVLSPTTVSAPPSATNTRVPATNTSAPPTATNTPIATTGSSATATSTVAATSTSVPSSTPGNQDPTPTQESGFIPTATTIVIPTNVVPSNTPTGSTGGPISQTPIPPNLGGRVVHSVARGDTVSALANRYSSTIDAIITANGLNNFGFIRVGQQLIIPVPGAVVVQPTQVQPTQSQPGAFSTRAVVVVTPTRGANVPPPSTGGPVVGANYVVQRGDTLTSIANRFSTTVGTIVQLNGIVNPNRLLVGQALIVPISGLQPSPTATQQASVPQQPPAQPPAAQPPATYVVRPGDNLYRIALRFGLSLRELATANNISNYNRVFVGQVLNIPRS